MISIHAPVKGATGNGRVVRRFLRYFNPRTREGCDRGQGFTTRPELAISIHAPVKGATRKEIVHDTWTLTFQSTHP